MSSSNVRPSITCSGGKDVILDKALELVIAKRVK